MAGGAVKLPPIEAEDRESFIRRHAGGKSVLHLGCADWPFTAEKLARGSLLHQRLAGWARELHGMDASGEGIRLMRNAGIGDLFHLDSGQNGLTDVMGRSWEVVVAGEIIEHTGNPGSFLESLHAVTDDDGMLIVTTPNYAPIKRLPRLLWRNEEVHPDHVLYFSFSTLSRLLAQSGWNPEEWRTYWRDVRRVSRWSNHVLKNLPFAQYYADGFCVACRRR